jgi:thiamine biosynthesis protein ThiS
VSTTLQDSTPYGALSGGRIVVNGEPRMIERGDTLAVLIRTLQLDPERIAVEMNRRIVKRAAWPMTTLEDGSQIEIVQFVGGG